MDHHRQLPSGLRHLQQPGGSMDKAPPDPVVPHLGELSAGVAVIPEAGGEVFQKEIKWKGLVRETGKENREGKKKKSRSWRPEPAEIRLPSASAAGFSL